MTSEALGRAFAAAREGRALRALTGHLDAQAKPARLYACLDLSVYVELPEVIAVHEDDADPLAPVLVWVRRDLPLELRFVGEPPRGLCDADPEDLFGVPCTPPGTTVAYSYRCTRKPSTSHTIGWCATD
jgi:hypothetical protein